VSATSGWYPDPGGGQGLYRYWDGRAWSAATTTDPASAPPPQGIVNPGSAAGTAGTTAHSNYGQGAYGQGTFGQGSYGQGSYGQRSYGQGALGQGTAGQGGPGQGAYGQGGSSFGGTGSSSFGGGRNPYGQGASGQPGQPGASPYASFQKRRSGVGWWVGAGVLLLVLVVVAVFAISRATSGGTTGGGASGQDSSNPCPPDRSDSPPPTPLPADGRVHAGPLSYPQLGAPWSTPTGEDRVPFGVNVLSQTVTVQAAYDGTANHDWVASVLVGELQAGDGFFTPQQGSQIVVRCVLGKFYGDNQVSSDVITDKATTVDGHDAWLVESKLTFDIPGLQTKGERLIVAIVQAGPERSGLFYASIPDTVAPELLQPARDALSQLKVDG
jgi:hypothetical protein